MAAPKKSWTLQGLGICIISGWGPNHYLLIQNESIGYGKIHTFADQQRTPALFNENTTGPEGAKEQIGSGKRVFQPLHQIITTILRQIPMKLVIMEEG